MHHKASPRQPVLQMAGHQKPLSFGWRGFKKEKAAMIESRVILNSLKFWKANPNSTQKVI